MLVPLDFILIALMQERGFSVSAAAPVGLVLFVQFVIVAVLCRTAEELPSTSAHVHRLAVPVSVSLPSYALVVFAAAATFLLARFLFTHKPIDNALLWSLSAFFLSLRFTAITRVSTVYSATAACILAASIVENSYLLAYHDELTTLPSRRAFNDALLRLQVPYSIAVVDIDHFKRFNDTYGHDTGDQVLRLVAAGLARVTGGGQAYRCGGEEFNILFAGKTTAQVVDHLEQLRAKIESSEFHPRGGDRRQAPRGPDRRDRRTSGRTRKGDAIRQFAQDSAPAALSVTVSIGVATSAKEGSGPDHVLQAADKALYRAKANGRNRVETASSPVGALASRPPELLELSKQRETNRSSHADQICANSVQANHSKSRFRMGGRAENSMETCGPDRQTDLDGKRDDPVPYVFASTAGRAVSRRSKVGWCASGHCPRRQDTSNG